MMVARKVVPEELRAYGYHESDGRPNRSCRQCRHFDARAKCTLIPGHPSVRSYGRCPGFELRRPPKVEIDERGRIK